MWYTDTRIHICRPKHLDAGMLSLHAFIHILIHIGIYVFMQTAKLALHIYFHASYGKHTKIDHARIVEARI